MLFLIYFGMSFGVILVQFTLGQSCWYIFMDVAQTWITLLNSIETQVSFV